MVGTLPAKAGRDFKIEVDKDGYSNLPGREIIVFNPYGWKHIQSPL